MLGALALFAIAAAAVGLLTAEPLFPIAAWTFASMPIVYLIVAAVRGTFARVAGAGLAAGLVLVVSASTVMALVSCGQRLEPGGDLAGCDLTDAELAGLTLTGADLTGADLSDVNLRQTNLDGADLRDADLTGATLEGTSMRRTSLEGADLTGVDLTGARFAPTSLAGATLDGANLQGMNLESVSLNGASATGANLTSANLSGADLSATALNGATLAGATFVGATGLADDVLARSLGVTVEALGGALTRQEVRLEPRPDILAGLSAACAGRGVAGTAPYPQGDLHPMVILDERGQVGVDTDQAAGLGWEPMAVRFAQLVACVSEEESIQVEHCPYTIEGGGGAASITRVRHQRDVRVIEASTGKSVFEQTLEGSTPPVCPLFHTFSELNRHETFSGSGIPFSKVQNEIARFVS